MRFFEWFFRTVESERERGKKNAAAFLATNPRSDAFMQYYGSCQSAKVFARNDKERAYDEGALEILKPAYYDHYQKELGLEGVD